MNNRVEYLIDALKLSTHPEGGYYREIYRSESMLKSPENGEIRNAVTDIYFLLVRGQISRFHKVVHDEIWHFYEGDPLELLEVDIDTFEVAKTVLGACSGVPEYKYCVKGGNLQAAYPIGKYSLMGCTVAPGFDFRDFEFIKENSLLSSKIIEKNPEFLHLI